MARLEDPDLAKLLDKFICVRVIQAWGLDLARFQFDYELTWAALFVNADGAVYGRYGMRRSHEKAGQDVSAAGFRKAAEGALELHSGYPGNANELEGKRGPKPPWPTPEAFPALKGRPNMKPATGERAACIHCHQVYEGELWSIRDEKQPVTDRLLWPYPAPEEVGLELELDERATVKSAASMAKEGGFLPGDKILRLDGQPILSVADVLWVLHQAADGATVRAEVERAGQIGAAALKLKAGWRRRGDYSWRSIAWSLRHRLAGTGELEAVPSKEGAISMALRIKKLPPNWVKDRNLSAAKALKSGDVIIAVDGQNNLTREADFLAHLLQKKAPGSEVELTILRGGKTVQVPIKLP